MKTYVLKTHLFHEKGIARDIEVVENFSLYKLAEAIVGAYGFDFDHAFGFFSAVGERYRDSKKKYELFADLNSRDVEPTGAASVKKTKISAVWKRMGDTMLFLFDYGDELLFVVELAGYGAKELKVKYPRVTASKGKAPEQYPEDEE